MGIRLMCVFLAIPAFAASFGGIVVTESGEPVSGALLNWYNDGPCQRSLSGGISCSPPTVNASTKIPGDGHFLVSNLPAGFYHLCVAPVAANQLGTCEWGGFGDSGPTGVTLAEGQQIDSLRLMLRRGTLAVFKVRDEMDAVPRFPFSLGVRTDAGAYYAARFDATRQAYTVLMPKGISLQLFIDTLLLVRDEAGNNVPIDAPTIRITTADDEVNVSLTAVASLVNAASYLPGIDRGDIASIFGTGFTDIQGVQPTAAPALPTEIAGTSVTVNGIAAPLFGIANQDGKEQIDFQFPHIPLSLDGTVTIVVNNNGRTQTFYTREWRSLGVFATVGHANGDLVSASNPAAPGETVTVYWTGLDAIFPMLPDGLPSPTSPPAHCAPYLNPMVRVGDLIAEVRFCGATPGLVGLEQIDIAVPLSLQSGKYDVHFAMSGVSGNTVQLPVQRP